MSSYLPHLLAVLVPVGVRLIVFLRWSIAARDDEIHRAFVYDALRAIAEQQGIVLDAPPPVRFIDLNTNAAEKNLGGRDSDAPAFFAKYVASLYTNDKVSATEAYARGISWGLMQAKAS